MELFNVQHPLSPKLVAQTNFCKWQLEISDLVKKYSFLHGTFGRTAPLFVVFRVREGQGKRPEGSRPFPSLEAYRESFPGLPLLPTLIFSISLPRCIPCRHLSFRFILASMLLSSTLPLARCALVRLSATNGCCSNS